MDRKTPIAVVGAGPAGASAALALKRRGFQKVVLFEKRAWPRAKSCAGGLGPKALAWLRRAGLLEAVGAQSVSIDAMVFTGPTRKREVLSASGVVAKVLTRDRFDAFMVDQAVAAGAEFRPGCAVEALAAADRGMVVQANGSALECGAVVVTTGAAGLPGVARPPHRYVASIMARYADFEHTPTAMEMVFTRELAPYYAWLFPEPDGTVNLGLIADRAPGGKPLHALFDEVLERYFGPRVARARQLGKRFGAPLHIAQGVGAVAAGRVLLAGECAGLVNAATGEGIPWGLESGELAAEVLLRHEPEELELAWRQAVKRRFRMRLFAAECARWFIGSPLFGPLTMLGRLPGMNQLLSRLFAKV